jgi:hypothetical protein
MSEQEYDDLWHYSERFTRDPLQRSELVTMAWKEGQRLGDRSTLGLMKSVMHFRAKELNKRSIFPLDEVGKRKIDAWSHQRVYVDKDKTNSLAEFLLPCKTTPLDYCIVNDFMDALSQKERLFLDDLIAGFKLYEIGKRNHLTYSHLPALRESIQEKAVAYL